MRRAAQHLQSGVAVAGGVGMQAYPPVAGGIVAGYGVAYGGYLPPLWAQRGSKPQRGQPLVYGDGRRVPEPLAHVIGKRLGRRRDGGRRQRRHRESRGQGAAARQAQGVQEACGIARVFIRWAHRPDKRSDG